MPDNYTKDPGEKLDYGRDWKYATAASRTAGTVDGWLATGETISTSVWAVPAGITETTPAPSHADGLATIWLLGGTAGEDYRITNTVTTSAGRIGKRTITINVRAR